jgi:hypothetical protein
MRKLTIGMCTYDDYDGVFFTIQAIRMYHPKIMNDVEFIIIDNNPTSESGKAVKDFTNHITLPCQYIPFDEYSSTSIKNKVFEYANTPYVLCIDCHILIQPGALKYLIDYYDSNLDDGNLLQGPLVYDDLKNVSTHFNRIWGSYMEGQWATDPRYIDKDSEPFEITGHGMGLFSCRKDSWLGYNTNFRGFGGEEIYIHDKYLKNNKKTLCLPFLGWMHRFTRIGGPPYKNDLLDRYRNYLIGHIELGKDVTKVDEIFDSVGTVEQRSTIKEEVLSLFI